MKRIRLLTAVLAAALLVSAATVSTARAGFNDGVTAYEAGDYKAAYNEWLPLAKANDPAAMRNIGHMYRRGLGVEQDYNKAMTWYKRAATLGFDRAQANVAGMYLAGEGVDRDYAQAASWFARAAQQGHVVSQYNLALLLENGLGVPKDEERALGWFVIAAKAGHPGAQKKAVELAAALKKRDGDDAVAGSGGPLIAAADDADAGAVEESVSGAEKTPEQAAPAAGEKDAVAAAAPETPKNIQKKGFYEALRSLVVTQGAKNSETAPAAASTKVETPPAASEPPPKLEEPVKVAKAEPVVTPADGGAKAAANAPQPAPRPAIKPAVKPEVSAVPVAKVKTAPVPPPAPEPVSTAGAAAVPPGTGLSIAEKLEMADLAYTLQQYQQSLSIWAQLAEQGNAEAQYRLGGLFNAGVAVPVDRVRAYYWWDKARANGSSEAAAALASLSQTLTYLEKRQIERVN